MMLRMFAAAAASVVLAGCAGVQRSTDQLEPRSVVALEIMNEHWSEVNVFLVRGSNRQRLGSVAGAAKKRFFVPVRLLAATSGVRLLVEPGDLTPAWSSEPLSVTEGQGLSFKILPDVSASMRVW